jgi:hypothetical protein
MANFIIGIISLTIGVVVLANVFITTIKGVNTTTWTAAEYLINNQIAQEWRCGVC